jgi:hypothetical protein
VTIVGIVVEAEGKIGVVIEMLMMRWKMGLRILVPEKLE